MRKQDRELRDEELAAVSGGFLGWNIRPQMIGPVSSPTGSGGGGSGGSGGSGGGSVTAGYNIQRNITV
jgi:hypothetical protein